MFPDFSGGIEAFKESQRPYINAIPDLHSTIEDQFGEGDKEVIRWSTKGSQKGDLPGIPTKGKSFNVTGITISRVSNGQIAEAWQVSDALGLMRQLGAQ